MRLDRPIRRGRLIGLTPLVDMVFILLVFFMLASTLESRRGLAVTAAAGPGSGAEAALLIRVHGDGGLDLAGRPVTLAGLETVLAPRFAADPDRPALVQADSAVPLARLVTVMDAVAAAGAGSIAVVGEGRADP